MPLQVLISIERRAALITEGVSWTHRLAVDRAQRRFDELRRHCDQERVDAASAYGTLCEVLFWVCLVDEGFDAVFGKLGESELGTFRRIRAASLNGQHMEAARWARNKMTHCLARPASQEVGSGPRLPGHTSFRWLPPKHVFATAIEAEVRPRGLDEYERLFAGRDVVETLLPVIAWVSEVRYDHRDPEWAAEWFRRRQSP